MNTGDIQCSTFNVAFVNALLRAGAIFRWKIIFLRYIRFLLTNFFRSIDPKGYNNIQSELFHFYQDNKSMKPLLPPNKLMSLNFLLIDLTPPILKPNNQSTIIVLVLILDHGSRSKFHPSVLSLMKIYKWCWEICLRISFRWIVDECSTNFPSSYFISDSSSKIRRFVRLIYSNFTLIQI